jgi:hypothetical protein
LARKGIAVGTSGRKEKGTGDFIMALIIWGFIVSVVLILPVFALEASGQLPKWLEVLALPIVFLTLIPLVWRFYPKGETRDGGTATPHHLLSHLELALTLMS